jgi:hypothetical protein
MKSKIFITLFILLSAVAFSGCGMMGMHGFPGMSHHTVGQNKTIIIKQFEQDGFRGELSVPSLSADKAALIQLLIQDNNGPVSNALVDFTFDEGNRAPMETIKIVGSQGGLYEVEYTPAAEGPLIVSADISGLPQTEGLLVSVQTNVFSNQKSAWSNSTIYALGGVGMGLMMLWMGGTHWH